MNIERLTLLKTMLTEVREGTWRPTRFTGYKISLMPDTPINFDMTVWAGPNPHSCGFAACALGHACLDPRFNAQGLALEHFGAPIFNGAPNINAATNFFEIDYPTARYLFIPDTYPRVAPTIMPADVIARIDILLETADER